MTSGACVCIFASLGCGSRPGFCVSSRAERTGRLDRLKARHAAGPHYGSVVSEGVWRLDQVCTEPPWFHVAADWRSAQKGETALVPVTVQLRNVEGTEAAMGWAGGHTIVVDRPEGKAGGMGLGFNGGQLLALAIGGCFCNDLRYTAERLGVGLGQIAVDVTIKLEGDPLIVTSASLDVSIETTDGSEIGTIIKDVEEKSTVSNSLQRGVPVTVRRAA